MAKRKCKKKTSIIGCLFRKKNLARDAIILLTLAGVAMVFFAVRDELSLRGETTKDTTEKESENSASYAEENKAENSKISTDDWRSYQSKWYGFELKYPPEWGDPIVFSAPRGALWEYRYQFKKSNDESKRLFSGFDVVVYSVAVINELSNTDEFPKIKNEEMKSQGRCQNIRGHLAENEEYPAEQIYVGKNDDCYSSAYFYSLTREDYIYNIVPRLADADKAIEDEDEIIRDFPEFIAVSSTFNLIDISRPKLAPAKPRINAPKPISFKIVDGRMVCAKKNDKPSKSKKTSKKHLDMECCLDPDEYPNPWCYYPSEKYGKLLGKSKDK